MNATTVSDVFFSHQTHYMTFELMDALDQMVWSPNAPQWFLDIFLNTAEGEEFTVTADQAKWIMSAADASYHHPEAVDNDSEGEYALILDTFDDFACYQRAIHSEEECIRVRLS